MSLLFDQLMYEFFLDEVETPFQGVAVYDASNCNAFIQNMYESDLLKLAEIPRRPPHSVVWVEATYDGVNESEARTFNATTGFVYEELQADGFRGLPLVAATVGGLFDLSTAHLFRGTGFHRVNRRTGPGRMPLGKVFHLGIEYLVWFSQDWTNRAAMCVPTMSEYRSERTWPVSSVRMNEFAGQISSYTDVFALLHCRNISTEEKRGGPRPKKGFKPGAPPFSYYKVLRLNLPSTLRPREQPADSPEAEAKMRLHLCRGHFKNLQAERYKEKGWHWWPAHWRGDPDLGTVDKIYKAAAATPVLV